MSKDTIFTVIKKSAAVAAAVFLFTGHVCLNKENMAFFTNGFGITEISAVQQNAFNVSAHINKAADAISRIFRSESSSVISSEREDRNKEPVRGHNMPLENAFDAVKGTVAAISFADGPQAFSHADPAVFCVKPADPGGAGMSGGYKFLLLFYFAVMLLFFASSRKEFNNIFDHKSIGTPAYV